jgi:Domain of unknown function (DUF4331)
MSPPSRGARRRRRPARVAIALAVTVASLVVGASAALASSHREAPLISRDPSADNTDTYAFVSPDRPDTVTIVANYIPLEEPAGGPNFYSFADDVQYQLHVVSSLGGGDPDHASEITYTFRFHTQTRNPNTFLYNTGPISSLTDPNWNQPQTYSVTRTQTFGGAQTIGAGLTTPPVNIGPRSTPNYDALASAAVHTLPGGVKVFAGQRDDPFFVDLGSVFDLLGLRPFNSLHLFPLKDAPGVDGVSGYNVHTIAIQVPIAQLTSNRRMPTGPTDPHATVGVYASANRQALKLFGGGQERTSGPWKQVSRLGEPLINEALIPLGKKDFWNSSDPMDDAQFEQYYTNPELAGLINLLYPSLVPTPTTNRSDLVSVLLTGIPGLNYTGPHPADLIRLNTAIPPSAPAGQGNRLGALAGDLAGYPNGRRLEDDVVDIDLRAIACGYGPILHSLLGLCDFSPNDLVGDGVDHNDKRFMTTFPYVATPWSGYDSPLHHP